MVQDVPQAKTYQLKGRHSIMSPEELSEQWNIGLKQARETITKTAQRLTCSDVMPLARKYKAYRVFHNKMITGMWATYNMYRQENLLDGNQYAHVFSNGRYFAEIYPMAKKSDAEQALEIFFMELGVPEELMVDGSK